MSLDRSSAQAQEEIPAAYLHLIDGRIGDEPQKVFPIWERDIFKIGRAPRSSTFVIDNDLDYSVSRTHCEVYVVVYEPTINHVYVRDRRSRNGTYVNGELIGTPQETSPGFLLQDGDVIEIKPNWKFVFQQTRSPPRHDLTDLQVEECKLFSDKYVLTDRCLGQGAEATVYLATAVSTKKQLVCKLVNLDKHQGKHSKEGIRRTLQETDILRQLRHPNILPYVDAISSPHTLYTFTELASGGDLMSFIYRHDRVGEVDARILIRQVISGLRYLHERGIVHRDLKPENILLAISPRASYHRVMLSDFGTSAVPNRSRMMTNVGTLQYRAPEFQYGNHIQTAAVDIWSLGVVVLVLLTIGTEVEPTDFTYLDRLDQDEIKLRLKASFSKMSKQPSSTGRTFLWECLQIKPSRRISALEAERHEWLCTPEKDLRMFRYLDRLMWADWESRQEIKPMPWELPDLLRRSPLSVCSPPHKTVPDQHFQKAREGQSSSLLKETSETSDYFNKLQDVVPIVESATNEVSLVRTEPSCKEPSANTTKVSETKAGETPTPKQTQFPWEGFLKPSPPSRPSPRRSKKKMPKIMKFSDAAFLPLTGLDRYLRQSSRTSQRRRVLQELKKTNSKFLVNPLPLTPNTPPTVKHSCPTPVAPKKRSKRDALGSLSDPYQLDVARIRLD